MENTSNQSNKRTGKHYAVSLSEDMYSTYIDAINNIADEDTLYILGNAIHKRRNGLDVLQYIMKRPNVKLILGNNEWYFLKCYEIMKKYDLCVDELTYYTRLNRYIGENTVLSEESIERGVTEIEKQMKFKGYEPKEISKREIAEIATCIENGGLSALRSFVKLTEKEQEDIIKYLINSTVIAFVKTEDKKVCLVHAAPNNIEYYASMLQQLKTENSVKFRTLLSMDAKIMGAFMEDCTENIGEQFKDGEDSSFINLQKMGFTTVFGRTVQGKKATKSEKDGSICLDLSDFGVALYCVEDGTVRYITKKYGETAGHISEPMEPDVIEDRLKEYLGESGISR